MYEILFVQVKYIRKISKYIDFNTNPLIYILIYTWYNYKRWLAMNELLKDCMESEDAEKALRDKIHLDAKKAKELLSFISFYFPVLLKFENGIRKFNNNLQEPTKNVLINEALEHFAHLNSDGKFLRGTLIALGYQNGGKNDDAFLDLALAYETFQTSILIHDDAIDKGDTRRGKPTINNIYGEKFNQLDDREHIASSLSICIGDLGFYMANQIIVSKYYNHPQLAAVLKYFNDVVMKTACGEFIDVYLPNVKQMENIEPLIMDIYKLKTAVYTVTGPYCLGMILSGNSKKDVEKFESILMDIGVAYQIRDDIFGVYGKYIGKSVTTDIEEFKQTILYSYTIGTSYKDELLKYYGKKVTKSELAIVRDIFIKSGAKEYAEKKMKMLFDRARRNIENSDINNKNALLGLMVYLEISSKW